MESENAEVLEVVRRVRRCLEDLLIFEGRHFPLPARGSGPEPEDEPGGAELEAFHRQICHCTRCSLGSGRTHFVFGSGNPAAEILFIGEAPGAEEDRRGLPFVGPAGQLLTRIIEAMHLRREEVYICNLLKCRPPGNRNPLPGEIATCEPYLKRQIELVQPRILCALGRIAAQALLKTDAPMRELRGGWHSYEDIPLIATYHPAALLRNPRWKRATWEDMKELRRKYDGVEL